MKTKKINAIFIRSHHFQAKRMDKFHAIEESNAEHILVFVANRIVNDRREKMQHFHV